MNHFGASLGSDIVQELNTLKAERSGFDAAYQDVASFILPNAPMNLLDSDWGMSRQPASAVNIYDTSPIWAVRRLANGIMSLLMPSTQYFHGLKVGYRFGDDVPHHEKEYLEKLRNFMFQVRALPNSGFWQANLAAIRQLVAFGTSLYMVYEQKGNRQQPFRYQYLALGQTYITVSSTNVTDSARIVKKFTARQAAQAYGYENLSPALQSELDKTETTHQKHNFIHCIRPREEIGSRSAGTHVKNSDFAYYVIEEATQKVVKDSGYFEFPIVRYVWDEEPGCPYGISPMMLLMPTVKNTNVMGQSLLLGTQSTASPAFATPANGVGGMAPIDLRPHAPNPGYIDQQGRMMIQPIQATGNMEWVAKMQQHEQENIKQGLFLNLFQILQDNPQITATESLIREQEKGELLGPVGHSISAGISTLVDREVGILNRNGAFQVGSPLEMPESLLGQEFGPEYTSPLDRARRSSEVIGIQRTMEIAAPLAELKPEIMENIDFHKVIRTVGEIVGAPQSIFVAEDERDEKIAQAQEMQQAQQAAALAQQAGDAAQSGANAVTAGADAVNAGHGAVPAGQELIEMMQGAGAQ